MKVAIVGYRKFNNYSKFLEEVSSALVRWDWEITEIISGGAAGVDTLAELFAADLNVPITIYKAQWYRYGRAAGPVRNGLIVKDSDVMIAFLHPDSRGTKNSIKQMDEAGKPIHTIILGESDV